MCSNSDENIKRDKPNGGCIRVFGYERLCAQMSLAMMAPGSGFGSSSVSGCGSGSGSGSGLGFGSGSASGSGSVNVRSTFTYTRQTKQQSGRCRFNKSI